MPLPTPGSNESKDQFMQRCMDETSGEFPDEEQRRAVCETQWERSMRNASKSNFRALQSQPGRSWYQIKNLDDGTAEVFLFDAIDIMGVDAEMFARELREIEADQINLRINSPGGNVFDGVAIAQALRQHPARVSARVEGVAASIASVIALAGDEVMMAKNSFIMIHEPFGGVMGTAEDMRHTASVLDKVSREIRSVYAERTGITEDRIQSLMVAETWMTSDEAIELGFADSVLGSEDGMQNISAFDFSAFANAPQSVAQMSREDRPRESDMERALRDAGCSRSEARAVVSAGKQALNQRDAETGTDEIASLLRERIDQMKTGGNDE